MGGTVSFGKTGAHVAVLTIDNPPMNALGPEMRATFLAALDQVETDPEIRVLVITGTGKAFSAGDDLKTREPKALSTFSILLQRVAGLKIPTLAAINGWCVGGGLELALCCDLRIASTEARFVCAGVNMGLLASAYRLPRLIGAARAKAMLLTGSPVDAATAEHYGLVTGLHGTSELMAEAMLLAERIASRAPLSVEAAKQVADMAADLTPEEAAALQGALLKTLAVSADHQEAVAAFREKRDPVFTRS